MRSFLSGSFGAHTACDWDAFFCSVICLLTGMPHTVISEIGSRTGVIRFVSLHAISAVRDWTGRIGVGVIVISGIVAIIISISQTGADQ